MKILIADDDPVSCRLMRSMLERIGYEVVIVTNGRAASEELAAPDGPKLALIDWMMPELDGPGVCREVRQIPDAPYVYIVLLTSKQSNGDIVEGLGAGADDYLTKPCNPSELKARLLTGRRILQLEEKLVEAREGMRFRATHDGLTSLLNRSTILASLRLSLTSFERDGDPFSLILCDIDHFKRVNDAFGHLAGDAILEHFASRLRNSIRSGDLIGRYGGEEFLIVLNGCRGDDLVVRAEQIRRAVCETAFGVREGVIEISASFGGTTVDHNNIPSSAEMIIDQADAALYQAKANGRNCVCIAERTSLVVAMGNTTNERLFREGDLTVRRPH